MIIQSFVTPGLSIYSYIISDEKTKQAIVVDPTRLVSPYIEYAQDHGLTITDIVETHVHADFASGSKELKSRLHNSPPIHCSAMGGEEWIPVYADIKVKNGDSLVCGNIKLEAVHTPGHTPEHLLWLCYDNERSAATPCLAFSGDLLFVGSAGRPDLLGEKQKSILARQLYESFFITLLFLPEFLEIYPAHGAGSLCGKDLSARSTTTLGYERLFNPFLDIKSIEEWTSMIIKDMPAAPINFMRLKKLNVLGPPLLKEIKSTLQTTPFMIDVRLPETFAKSHIKGSVNIPLGPSFCNWVSSVLGEDRPIGLIAENITQIYTAIHNLQLIGFDHIVKQEIWDERSMATRYPLETLSTLPAKTLQESIQKGHLPYILDVRTPAEWNSGHIDGAHHLELGYLAQSLKQIPKDTLVHTVCGSGMRASVAASYLKANGYAHVVNVEGGMIAWYENLPNRNQFVTH